MSGGESDVFVGVVPFVAAAQTRSFKRAAQRTAPKVRAFVEFMLERAVEFESR